MNPESAPTHGVLLVNLGTPQNHTPKALSSYLKEFLLDKRVIDLPFLLRQFLVRAIIIPKRYKKVAKTYEEIWTADGSPLLAYGKKLQHQLQEALGASYKVALGMRYQEPSLISALLELRNSGVRTLTIVPLFPQYASATTGSILEEVCKEMQNWQVFPNIHLLSHFHEDPGYIAAFSERGKSYELKNYDHLLFSFHGLPVRHLKKAKEENHILCYRRSCFLTAKAIYEKLNTDLPYTVSFQSRLGKEEWCRPYITDTLSDLKKEGYRRLLVFSPAFVADCLETLYEIEVELKQEFLHNGGEVLDLVASLNDHPTWVGALKNMILKTST
jgi:protoporphyrin/coproporphyrin ferrochelatase